MPKEPGEPHLNFSQEPGHAADRERNKEKVAAIAQRMNQIKQDGGIILQDEVSLGTHAAMGMAETGYFRSEIYASDTSIQFNGKQFGWDDAAVANLEAEVGKFLDANEALKQGLRTAAVEAIKEANKNIPIMFIKDMVKRKIKSVGIGILSRQADHYLYKLLSEEKTRKDYEGLNIEIKVTHHIPNIPKSTRSEEFTFRGNPVSLIEQIMTKARDWKGTCDISVSGDPNWQPSKRSETRFRDGSEILAEMRRRWSRAF